MSNLYESLTLASNLIENKNKYNLKYNTFFQKIYPFTTQNLKDQYNIFDLSSKDILTVQESGDQILELLLNKAINIDTFDINPLTEYYWYLKMACFLAKIVPEEYFNYLRYKDYPKFSIKNDKCFNLETFNKISSYLPTNYRLFWETLYKKYSSLEIRRENYLFSSDEEREKVFAQTLNYFDSINFEKLYTLVSKLNYHFIESDFKNLPHTLSKQYDFIDLSNIIRYSDIMWKSEPLRHFQEIINQLIPYLKDDGIMIVGYFYQANTEYKGYECYQKKIRDLYFPQSKFNYYYFKGITDIKTEPQKLDPDAILVYQKRKNH